MLVAVAVLEPLVLAAAATALLALNAGFYRLLLSAGGPALLGAGVGLHVVHLLSAAVSLPLGAATYVLARLRPRRIAAPQPGVPRIEP